MENEKLENLMEDLLEKFPHFKTKQLKKIIEENNYDKEKIMQKIVNINKRELMRDLKMRYGKDLNDEELGICAKKANFKPNRSAQNCVEMIEQKNPKYVIESIKDKKEYVILDKMEENKDVNILGKDVLNKKDSLNEKEMIKNISFAEKKKTFEETYKELQSKKVTDILTLVSGGDKYLLKINYPEKNSYSWIGFYRKGDMDGNYKTSQYLTNIKDDIMVIDKPYLNGKYEFRLFKSYSVFSSTSSYDSVCKVEDEVLNVDELTLKVDEKDPYYIIVSWKLATAEVFSVAAFLTVHKEEETRVEYSRRREYIKTQTGTCQLKKPIHDGVYEARIYYQQEKTCRLKSNTIGIL